MGIDHHGIVSDEEKIDLYRRAKVFLFPSLFQGFGIAVGEALSAKMIVLNDGHGNLSSNADLI